MSTEEITHGATAASLLLNRELMTQIQPHTDGVEVEVPEMNNDLTTSTWAVTASNVQIHRQNLLNLDLLNSLNDLRRRRRSLLESISSRLISPCSQNIRRNLCWRRSRVDLQSLKSPISELVLRQHAGDSSANDLAGLVTLRHGVGYSPPLAGAHAFAQSAPPSSHQ